MRLYIGTNSINQASSQSQSQSSCFSVYSFTCNRYFLIMVLIVILMILISLLIRYLLNYKAENS